MSWFSGKSTHAKRTVVIFDIGSATVGCNVVLISQQADEKPQILFSTRSSIPFQSAFRYDRFVTGMLEALHEAAAKADDFLTTSRHRADEIACVLSSVWYVAKTHHLSLKREEPIDVSSKLVEKMLEEVPEHGERKNYETREQKHMSDLVLIERKLVDISLNGYSVSDPFDKQATRIDLSLYAASTSVSLQEHFISALEKHFPDTDTTFHSHALSVYTVVCDYCATTGDFLLIDVGGEVTDITLVLDSTLMESISIPIGAHTIARAIKEHRGSTHHEALSFLRMAGEASTPLNTESAEYKVVFEEGLRWKQSIIAALEKLTSTALYPRSIFLTASKDTTGWLTHLLELDIEGEHSFTVTPVVSHLIRNQLVFNEGVTPDGLLEVHTLHIARTD